MFWDIAIVFGIGLSQLLVTIYAVWVSVTEHKLKTAFVLAVIGAMGIALTVYGAIRSGTAQAALQAQLNKIQQNTEKPPSVTVNPQINIPPAPAPPPQHTHLSMLDPQPVGGAMPYWPLSPQNPFEVNIGFMNAGEFAADDVIHGEILSLIDIGKIRKPSQVASVYRGIMDTKQLLGELHKLRGHGLTVLPHTGQYNYVTVQMGALKQTDIDQVIARQTAICASTRIEWKDKSGCYFSDSFYCLWAESGSPGYNWHHEVDQEIKCH